MKAVSSAGSPGCCSDYNRGVTAFFFPFKRYDTEPVIQAAKVRLSRGTAGLRFYPHVPPRKQWRKDDEVVKND